MKKKEVTLEEAMNDKFYQFMLRVLNSCIDEDQFNTVKYWGYETIKRCSAPQKIKKGLLREWEEECKLKYAIYENNNSR